jgi:hypothetical protein
LIILAVSCLLDFHATSAYIGGTYYFKLEDVTRENSGGDGARPSIDMTTTNA